LRHQLADTDAQLAAALTAVRSQARAVTVRGLLRAGTLCAHAIEGLAAAAAASRNRDADTAARHLDDVREAVSALVSELEMHE
jgi:cysteine sulfinate desulfinase/cysteine desulfurase-like protein